MVMVITNAHYVTVTVRRDACLNAQAPGRRVDFVRGQASTHLGYRAAYRPKVALGLSGGNTQQPPGGL